MGKFFTTSLREDHLAGDQEEKTAECFFEDLIGTKLGDACADPSAEEKPEGHEPGRKQPDMAGLIIPRGGQKPDGQNHKRQGCPLGLMLRHAKQVNQDRDDDCAAPDSEDSAGGSRHQSQ